jgi:hypothetical protein
MSEMESSVNSSQTTFTTASSSSSMASDSSSILTTINENKIPSDLISAKNALNSMFNVSSLNNFLLKINPIDDMQSVNGARQNSIDLSHASRDPMISGPTELFNKNVSFEQTSFVTSVYFD